MSYIVNALKLKQELDSLRPIAKEDEQRIMQKLRLDWNYHSNHLEGNSLSYGETKALILHGITAQGKPLKDHIEIEGHNEAIKWILDITSKTRSLTEKFIRELHKLILKTPYDADAITPEGKKIKRKINVGAYKQTPNHVKTKTGEIFRFATPEETPAKMHDLMVWYEKEKEKADINPILLAAQFHYEFVLIHPFDDGNGRTARILMNFILMQFGYPPAVIRTDDKENYYAALQQADAGIIEPFIEYIAKSLCHSLEIMIKGAKGENIEEVDDLDKEISLLDQKLKKFNKKITKIKSKEVILKLLENTITPVIFEFMTKGKVFEKYYVNSIARFHVNGVGVPITITDKTSIIEEYKQLIRKPETPIQSIEITYSFTLFNIVEIGQFDYQSSIKFRLERAKYFVHNSKKELVLEKFYDQQLTETEIKQLVKMEMREHKNLIEAKIKELE